MSLAEGTAKGFRVKFTKVLLSEPEVGTPWILPLGGMAKAGFDISWKDEERVVRDHGGHQRRLSNGVVCRREEDHGMFGAILRAEGREGCHDECMAGKMDHQTTGPTLLLMMMWMRKEYPKSCQRR